jgi:carbamoyl-phosphate synthase large subunit
MKILIEAVGCLTSGYLIKAIKDAGHHCVASDIHGNSAGALFADSFIDFPKIHEPTLWQIIERKLVENNIDVVIPPLMKCYLVGLSAKSYLIKEEFLSLFHLLRQ